MPIVIAGNRVCSETVKSILEARGKFTKVVENVFPTLDRLDVEPSRTAIREIFMDRIIQSKGLDKAEEFVNSIVMPTPMAVLKAAQLLALGIQQESGLGEVILVDIGGSTTDVHSIAQGSPSDPSVTAKGLMEPLAKRTVEGDLGIRFNALTVYELAGEEKIKSHIPNGRSLRNLHYKIRNLVRNVNTVPESDEDFQLDTALGCTVCEIAMERHAGQIERVQYPNETVYVQHGKDLTGVKTVIGTGGIFAYGKDPEAILRSCIYIREKPFSLRPKTPVFYIDEKYIMYAIGLLSEINPGKALRIAKRHLKRLI